jgi:DNA-binding GntR family transcriptional regulator
MQGSFGGRFGVREDEHANVLPIQRTTVATAIAEMLREEMLSGLLPPGTPLYDAEIVNRVGAARSTVREALAELAHEGLVVHSLQSGVQVTPITAEDVHDIYAVRRVYERAGLKALIERRPVDTSWLRAAAERMGEAAVSSDWRAAVEADMAFHLALVAAAGAHRLTGAAQGALTELRMILAVADRVADDLPALVAEHSQLVAVIEAGRPRRARAALEDHLLRGEAVSLAAVVASEAA